MEFCELYDSLGNLTKRDGLNIKGVIYGKHRFYKPNHKLYLIKEYVVIDDNESYLNQFFKIGETGDTIKRESNYFSIKMNKDTLKLGETLNATITLVAPCYDTSKIIIEFRVPDDSKLVRIISSSGYGDYSINYDYTPTHKGEFELTGKILEVKDDFKVYGDSTDKYTTRILYFSRSYYVQ